jgi:hypothetical protein
MSYTITFTNGKTLAVIADQSFDEVSTSLTLVGKNSNNYGTHVNNNFVGLLENFADVNEPRSPVAGQVWFDTAEGRLKVYTSGNFKPVGGPTVGSAQPTTSVAGDLWVDTIAGILKWYDGSEWVQSGKQFSNETGKEGWLVESYADITNTDIPVSVYYSNNTPVAVMTDSEIDYNPEAGFYIFTSTITTLYPGVTLNPTIPNIRFYGTATSAESFTGDLDVDSFLRKDTDETGYGSLELLNNDGISIGTLTNIKLYVPDYVAGTTSTAVILGTLFGENLEIRYNGNAGNGAVAVHVNSELDRVGVLTNDPQTDIDLAGNVIIRGNLEVQGTQFTVESTTMVVEDKNIELGVLSSGTPTNITANGGGIILQGTTNHTWLYNLASPGYWESNIGININDDNDNSSYRIDSEPVLERDPDNSTYYRLGARVLSAPGLTNLPVLSLFTVTDITLYNNVIESAPFTDLVLRPGNGVINLTSVVTGNTTTAKIVGMGQTEDTDPDSTAVTKQYFEDKLALSLGGFVGRKPYTLSLDITGFVNVNDEIIAYLDSTLPVDGFGNQYYVQPDGARCSVMCTKYDATTATYVLSNLNTSTVRTLLNHVTDIAYTATSTTTSFISTVSSTSTLVVTDFELAGNVTITTPMPSITRTVKLFSVIGGYWTYVEDIDTNYMTSYTTATVSTGVKTFTVNNLNPVFTTGTNIIIRETETQTNYLEGSIVEYGTGTNYLDMTVNVTFAETTGTYNAWIIRLA